MSARIIAPVAVGLEFLDVHWRSVLIVTFPFLAPIVRELIRDLTPRLRKAGSLEFDAVPLENEGVREKPSVAQPGA